MKTEHRHELQTNQLAKWLDAKIEQIKPYTQAIIGMIAAATILFAVYLYLKQMDHNAAQTASDELVAALVSRVEPLKALQATVENHPKTLQTTIAQLLIAEQLLHTRAEQLFTNKTEGTKNLGKSADSFIAIETSAKDPMLRAWTLFGLGRTHESLGELDRANSNYEKLLKDYGNGALADLARDHLQNLKKQSTKEFYDWFAKQDPRPISMDREPGRPRQKPAFDSSDPTAFPSGNVKFPSFENSLTPSTPAPDTVPANPTAPTDPTATAPPTGAPPAGETPTSTPPAAPQANAPPAGSDGNSPASSEPATPAK